jgi:hypothetical protein
MPDEAADAQVRRMTPRTKLVIVGVGVLALAGIGIGTGTAIAASGDPAPPAETPAEVQHQSSVDENQSTADEADSASEARDESQSGQNDRAATGDSTENGHQDPPGADAQHDFEGQE